MEAATSSWPFRASQTIRLIQREGDRILTEMIDPTHQGETEFLLVTGIRRSMCGAQELTWVLLGTSFFKSPGQWKVQQHNKDRTNVDPDHASQIMDSDHSFPIAEVAGRTKLNKTSQKNKQTHMD